MALEAISIGLACAILIVIVCAFYYFWDSSVIDESESSSLENETPEERAKVIARHRAQIEEENEKQNPAANYLEDPHSNS